MFLCCHWRTHLVATNRQTCVSSRYNFCCAVIALENPHEEPKANLDKILTSFILSNITITPIYNKFFNRTPSREVCVRHKSSSKKLASRRHTKTTFKGACIACIYPQNELVCWGRVFKSLSGGRMPRGGTNDKLLFCLQRRERIKLICPQCKSAFNLPDVSIRLYYLFIPWEKRHKVICGCNRQYQSSFLKFTM